MTFKNNLDRTHVKQFTLNILVFVTFLWTFQSKAATNRDFEIIRRRVVNTLMEPPVNEARVKELITTLRNDGTWEGINYEDVRREAFQHTRHLSNMLLMSRAYKKKGSSLYGRKELKNAINLSLNYWLKNNFICDNWWNNEIGTPDVITAMLLILDKDLTPEQIEKASVITSRSHINAAGARQSGDRIRIAGIQAKNMLFKRDVKTFEMLVKVIEGEIRFVPTNQRGMQYDYSFHHRDDRVNNTLSYGLNYAEAFIEWTTYLNGTQYQLSGKAINQLIDYYLDGICKQMVYGKYPDPATANRDISRPGDGGAMSPLALEQLMAVTDYRKSELQAIADVRKNKAKPDFSFGKFFWLSEYYVHQRPNYFTSVRMFSNRNANMEEPYNSEGLTNHHRGDGTNYLSLTGTEYYNLAPVNDWQMIPGTTVLQKPALPSENEIQKYGAMDFAGAVTDGIYGAAAFDFISPHDPLRARKSWFFFDNEYVCLGAGIHSDSNLPVVTTVNQCLKQGETVYNIGSGTGRKQTLQGTAGENIIEQKPAAGQILPNEQNRINWALHGGVGYIFPEAANVHISAETVTGNWFTINRQTTIPKDEVSMDVFKLWIDHGNRVNNGTYQYIVMPGAGEDRIAAAWQKPAVTVLSNTPDMQAVWHNTLNMLQVVFYKNGSIQLSGKYRLTIDSPGIVMVRAEKEGLALSVADPSRKLGKIHLSVNMKIEKKDQQVNAVWNDKKGESEITIDLPQEAYAGQSVTIKFDLLR